MHIAQPLEKVQPVVGGLEVENFRGLRNAGFSGFASVNVLVGKNGSGKSSLLEALHVGLALDGGLDYVVRRRGWFGLAAVEALFHYGAKEAKVKLLLRDGSREEVVIKSAIPHAKDLHVLASRGLNINEISMLHLNATGKVTREARFYIDASGKTQTIVISEESGESKVVHDVAFVDWGDAYTYDTPEKTYSDLIRKGGEEAKGAVIKSLQTEYEGLCHLEILPTHDGKWLLHLIFKDRAVPYYVEGDGIRYALMYFMKLLAPKEAVLLLEEPELHTHPGLLEVVTRAIVNSYIERGNQLFISTHSLELIEMLLEEAGRRGMKDEELKVYRLRLVEGRLESEEHKLSEAREALNKLGWDLRR